jgi:hypothetical protein
MSDFELIFCNPETFSNEIAIPFTLQDSSTANIWIMLMENAHLHGTEIEQDRWTGFETNHLTLDDYILEINELIDVVNNDYPNIIPVNCQPNPTQQEFNILHTYFETYRGTLLVPHDYYNNGTEIYREAIERLNKVIHVAENKLRKNATPVKEMRRTNIGYKDGVRVELPTNEFDLFDINMESGVIYLDYTMRGKTLHAVSASDDFSIGPENVLPYKWISTYFILVCDGWTPEFKEHRDREFDQWAIDNADHLKLLGIEDHRALENTNGWIPLARADVEDTGSLLESRQYFKGVNIL